MRNIRIIPARRNESGFRCLSCRDQAAKAVIRERSAILQ